MKKTRLCDLIFLLNHFLNKNKENDVYAGAKSVYVVDDKGNISIVTGCKNIERVIFIYTDSIGYRTVA